MLAACGCRVRAARAPSFRFALPRSMPIPNRDNDVVIPRGDDLQIAKGVDGPGFLVHDGIRPEAVRNRVFHVSWWDAPGLFVEHVATTLTFSDGHVADGSSAAWQEPLNRMAGVEARTDDGVFHAGEELRSEERRVGEE